MPIPTEEEALAAGEATLPEDMPVLEVPALPAAVEPKAVVQARRITPVAGGPDAVETSEFTVTAVAGTRVSRGGGLPDLDAADGWRFEVISRAPLLLPQTRSTIVAQLTDGRVVTLTGKGVIWMDENGDLVDVAAILSFTLGGAS